MREGSRLSKETPKKGPFDNTRVEERDVLQKKGEVKQSG